MVICGHSNLASEDEQLAWLQLARCKNVGPITFSSLLTRYKTPQNALYEISKINSQYNNIVIPSKSSIENEIKSIANIGGKLILSCEDSYPRLLKEIKDPPPVIVALGNIDLLKGENNIAIVGARYSSHNGYKFAQVISHDLAQCGLTIVSGLASGIDTAAHQVILQHYPTIAVMGNGINIVYPKENASLYSNIIEKGGVVITEYPYNTEPKPQHFPRRNRIISGLSLGVVVVEAGIKSGSLITAKFALAQGREVFAVPGFPLDYRYKGNNYLLKEGATLVESSNDVVNSLQFINKKFIRQNELFEAPCEEYGVSILSSIKANILSRLTTTPSDIDEIISRLNVDLSAALVALSELELENKLERHIGNSISIKM